MVAGRSSLVTAKDPRASHRVGNSDQMPTEWARGVVDDVVMRLWVPLSNFLSRVIRTARIPQRQKISEVPPQPAHCHLGASRGQRSEGQATARPETRR